MKFRENLNCTNCELIDWGYDSNDILYPVAYELAFNFYGTDVTATVTTEELQKPTNYVEFSTVETNGDLLASFEQMFEYYELKPKVEEMCKKCWDNSLNSNGYDFKGYEVRS